MTEAANRFNVICLVTKRRITARTLIGDDAYEIGADTVFICSVDRNARELFESGTLARVTPQTPGISFWEPQWMDRTVVRDYLAQSRGDSFLLEPRHNGFAFWKPKIWVAPVSAVPPRVAIYAADPPPAARPDPFGPLAHSRGVNANG